MAAFIKMLNSSILASEFPTTNATNKWFYTKMNNRPVLFHV